MQDSNPRRKVTQICSLVLIGFLGSMSAHAQAVSSTSGSLTCPLRPTMERWPAYVTPMGLTTTCTALPVSKPQQLVGA